eukprot:gene15509-biopygen8171
MLFFEETGTPLFRQKPSSTYKTKTATIFPMPETVAAARNTVVGKEKSHARVPSCPQLDPEGGTAADMHRLDGEVNNTQLVERGKVVPPIMSQRGCWSEK